MCLWISEPLIYFYHLQMFDIHIVTLKVLKAVTELCDVRSQITASFMFTFRSILSVLWCMNNEKVVLLLFCNMVYKTFIKSYKHLVYLLPCQ